MHYPKSEHTGNQIIQSSVPCMLSMYGLASDVVHAMKEKNPTALIVGTHTKLAHMAGDGTLSSLTFPEASRTRVLDEPANVIERLREMRVWNAARFSVVISAFETHHFTREQLEEFFELTGALSHGASIYGDYAFAGQESAEIRKVTTSKAELDMQKIYGGFDDWRKDHEQFTAENYVHAAKKADWKSLRGFAYPAMHAGVIASQVLSQYELCSIAGGEPDENKPYLVS